MLRKRHFYNADILHIVQKQKCALIKCARCIAQHCSCWSCLSETCYCALTSEGLCHWLTYQTLMHHKVKRCCDSRGGKERGHIDVEESNCGAMTVIPGGKRTFRW